MAGSADENCLAGQHITNDVKTKGCDGNALTRHDVFGLAVGNSLAVHERTNAVWISKSEQTVAGDHRNTGIPTSNAAVHRTHGAKHRFDVHVRVALNAQARAALTEFHGQGVQKQF